MCTAGEKDTPQTSNPFQNAYGDHVIERFSPLNVCVSFGQGHTRRLSVNSRSVLVMLALLSIMLSHASADQLRPIVQVQQELGDDATCAAGGSACKTIGRGLDVAAANGIVMVAPGTYSGTGNCDVAITRPVTLASSRGQRETIWDCEHKSRCLRILANATVEGFTFQRGFAAPITNCSEIDDPEQRNEQRLISHATLHLRRVDNHSFSSPTQETQIMSQMDMTQEAQKPRQNAVSPVASHSSYAFLALLVPSPVGLTSVPFRSADDRALKRALQRLSIQDLMAVKEALHISLRERTARGKEARANRTVPHTMHNATGSSLTDSSWPRSSGKASALNQESRSNTVEWDSMMHASGSKAEDGPTFPHGSPPHLIRRLHSRTRYRQQPLPPQARSSRPFSTAFDEDNPIIASAGGCILVAGVGIDVTIAHSVIIGGLAPHGGGIAFSGTHALLSNVSVTSNNAEWGGGVLAFGGTLQIVGCVISNNTAVNRGRVVSWPTNAAVGGGAALFRVEHAHLINTSITKNTATSCGRCGENTEYLCPWATGGGISCSDSVVAVSSSHVTLNVLRSEGNAGGGGIYHLRGNVAVSASHVASNSLTSSGDHSTSLGGGIGSWGGTISVSSSHVTHNSQMCSGSECAMVGGGIGFVSGNATFCEFGCIANAGGIASVSLSQVGFNSLVGYFAFGGGIYTRNGTVSVSSSSVTSNEVNGTRSRGGGIWSFYGNVSVSSSFVTSHPLKGSDVAQGGAIWASGTVLTISSTSLSHNVLWAPSAQGGALWMTRSSTWVQGCHFSGNQLVATSSGSGGGIYAVSAISLEVTASNVSYNLLASNTSQGAGGGLFLLQCSTRLVGTLVSNNRVSGPGSGGGLMVGSHATLWLSGNTMITRNHAQIGGGMHVSGRVHANNTDVVYNSAVEQGGAAFLSREADFVFDGSVAGNTAGSIGSAVFSTQQPSSNSSTRLHLYGNVTAAAGWAVFVNTLSSSQIKMGVDFFCESGSRMNFTNLVSFQQQTQATYVPCPAGCGSRYCCASWPTELNITTSFPSMTFVAVQCNPCDKGRYSFEMGSISNSHSTNFCRECPFGGDCPGGSTVDAQAGFWGTQHGDDLVFNRCPVGYCCPVSSQVQTSCAFDHCEGNRTGTLCGQCPKGSGNVYFSTRCTLDKDCTDAAWAVPLLLVALAIYTAYMVLSPSKASTGLLAVIIFFYQVASYVRGEAEWRHSSALAVSSIESVFLGGAFGGGGGSSARGVCVVPGMTAALVTAGNYLVPVLVASVMGLWYGATRLRDRKIGREPTTPVSWKQSLSVETLRSASPGVASLVRLLLLSYSSLASTSLRLLVCRTLAGVDGNNLRFFLDASVVCPAPWQLAPFLVLLGLVPLPVLLVRWVHQHREQFPDAAALLQAPMAPGRRHWQAVMLYQRLVLAVLFTAIQEPLWRGILVGVACLVNLVLAVWFRPFHAVRIQGIYVSVLVLLVVLALLALPGMARESLSAPEQFGNNAADGAALEWLQFVVILIPGCAIAAMLVMPLWKIWFRRVWSRLRPYASRTADGDLELRPVDDVSPPADVSPPTQA